jgi:nucleoside 2-deoxyribosyltransferase
MKEEYKNRPPRYSLKCIKAFLSMPYGKTNTEKVYWKVLAGAIRETARLTEGPRLEVHSAADELSSLVLKESVKKLLDECDFTIAVLTGRNPNIFWEIGYTEAQKKPVVYLVDEETEDLSKSPVLVAEALKCAYRESSLSHIVEQQSLPEDMAVKLKAFLEQAIKSVQATPKLPRFTTCCNREECHLPSLIAKATKRIYLITSNLSYFADFDNFTIGDDKEVFAFDPPVERNVEVKILTMDPESQLVKCRAEQLGLGHDVVGYREELRESARRFYLRYPDRPKVNICLYDDLPLQITLIVDEEVVTCVMSRGSRSRENIHFLLDMATPGAQRSFEAHFQEVAAAPSKHIRSFKWATSPRQ